MKYDWITKTIHGVVGIDGVAYATDWGVFYTGRSLFILNGDEWKNITIDFIMPSEWHITTPFDR